MSHLRFSDLLMKPSDLSIPTASHQDSGNHNEVSNQEININATNHITVEAEIQNVEQQDDIITIESEDEIELPEGFTQKVN